MDGDTFYLPRAPLRNGQIERTSAHLGCEGASTNLENISVLKEEGNGVTAYGEDRYGVAREVLHCLGVVADTVLAGVNLVDRPQKL